MATTVFIRDDDLGKPFGNLARFHRLFIDREIPIAYQVVPDFLGEETAAEAVALRSANPDLVELHQHGTAHEQTLGGEHRWSEFAGNRPLAEQRDALERGRAHLVSLLGDDLDQRVFTPPAHKYGPDTLRALDAMGIEVLSGGVHIGLLARVAYAVGHLGRRVRLGSRMISYHGSTIPGSSIREWSCAIDVDQDGRGNRVTRDLADLREEFVRARSTLPVVGLMLHHECYTDDTKFAVLEAFLDGLCSDSSVQFRALGRLDAPA